MTHDVEGATDGVAAAPDAGGFWWDMVTIVTGDEVLLWQKRTRGQASSFVKSARAQQQQ